MTRVEEPDVIASMPCAVGSFEVNASVSVKLLASRAAAPCSSQDNAGRGHSSNPAVSCVFVRYCADTFITSTTKSCLCQPRAKVNLAERIFVLLFMLFNRICWVPASGKHRKLLCSRTRTQSCCKQQNDVLGAPPSCMSGFQWLRSYVGTVETFEYRTPGQVVCSAGRILQKEMR